MQVKERKEWPSQGYIMGESERDIQRQQQQTIRKRTVIMLLLKDRLKRGGSNWKRVIFILVMILNRIISWIWTVQGLPSFQMLVLQFQAKKPNLRPKIVERLNSTSEKEALNSCQLPKRLIQVLRVKKQRKYSKETKKPPTISFRIYEDLTSTLAQTRKINSKVVLTINIRSMPWVIRRRVKEIRWQIKWEELIFRWEIKMK